MQEINQKNSRIWSRLGQRGTVCGVALPELMEKRDDCYVLTADLAHLSGLDRIKLNYPRNFINVGIAEQNLIGVAAGLAFEGNQVFATTYATFLSMRCFEQIRHNLGYQKANVKLIGSSSGLAMGMSGNTHYSYEDIALMRTIPNMIVVSPADAAEAYMAMHCLAKYTGPAYLRLTGNMNHPILNQEPYEFQIGKSVIMREGEDIALIATGVMVGEALKVADELGKKGYSSTVINMHTIKPLDKEVIYKQFNKKIIVSMEEHSIIGGLGSAIAEQLVQKEDSPRQLFIGIEDMFVHPGEYEYLKCRYKLSHSAICDRILKEL